MSKTKHILLKPMVISCEYRLILVLVGLMLINNTFCQKTDDKKSIESYLLSDTAFPDSLYNIFTWNEFENWEKAQQPFDVKNPDYQLLNAAVFYYTNEYRNKKKKPALRFSSGLRDAAFYHSIQMSEKGFYNHINPHNKKMRDPMMRIRTFGVESNYYAENINKEFAIDYNEGKTFDRDEGGLFYTLQKKEYVPSLTYLELARRIVQGWIDSKPHRENILKNHFTHLGCGVFLEKKTLNSRDIPKIIATQTFAGDIYNDLYNLR